MLEIARFGSFEAPESSLVHATDEAGAFALSVTKTRPAPVAAHSVPVFCGALASHAMAPPFRSAPKVVEASTSFGAVRSRAPAAPMRTKSPQFGFAADVVNSGQFASRNA